MRISEITYSENLGQKGEWVLEAVDLGQLNLIVGKNAVGKTRTINVLDVLSGAISGKIPLRFNGNWDIKFESNKHIYNYILELDLQKGIKEKFLLDDKPLLNREYDNGEITIFSNNEPTKKKRTISPPIDKLVNHVQRDKLELPYLEDLVRWAETFHTIRFNSTLPNALSMRTKSDALSPHTYSLGDNLSGIPYLLEELLVDKRNKDLLLKQIKYIGFDITDVAVTSAPIVGVTPAGGISMLTIQEKGVPFTLDQPVLSSGMYRAIAVIIALNYLKYKREIGTIAIDDFCEGLDFGRSSKLATLLFEESKKLGIQLIVTTNDRFLMNAVDIKYWNIFEKDKCTVRSFNYKNNKAAFDQFTLTGLNNFDFFAYELYKATNKGPKKKAKHD